MLTIRIARPTRHLEALVNQYRDGLGLERLGGFEDHDGYDGVMLGRPDCPWHLEFTAHAAHAQGAPPNDEHLLVLYVPGHHAWLAACAQAEAAGFIAAPAANPYWDRAGRTFVDRDGYRVVLQEGTWPPGKLDALATVGWSGPASDAAAVHLAPGTRLGRFEILRELGRGGMAVVYQALDPRLKRTVAIKLLHEPIPSERLRTRFLAEAQLTAQLQHPNIVPVHEVDTTPEGRLWFAMKQVEGQTLLDILRGLAGGDAMMQLRWSLKPLLRAFVQVCQAAAYAHEQGVLHRDLKPANIMLGRFGEVLVLDWGVSLLVGSATAEPAAPRGTDSGSSLRHVPVDATVDGASVGTPGYMAPEQALAERAHLGPQTDVFGLGAILYEILTLERAFPGDSPQAVVYSMMAGEVEEPRGRAPERGIDAEVAEIAMRALARNPAARFSSALDLAEAVEDYLDGSRRRERADALVAIAVDADQAERAQTDAYRSACAQRDRLAATLPTWAAVTEKHELIEALERVDALEAERPRAFAELVRLAEAALVEDPTHEEARSLLADAWMRRFDEAEESGDHADRDVG